MNQLADIAGLAEPHSATLPVHPLRPSQLETFLHHCEPKTANFVRALGFSAQAGGFAYLAGQAGLEGVLFGLGEDKSADIFGLLCENLPAGSSWHLEPGDYDPDRALLAVALGAYRYDRLKPRSRALATIAADRSHRGARELAAATCFARDLINAPANLLGPAELADAGAELAARFGARIERITGDALGAGYPALAAVGAGSSRAPEMLRFVWGDDPALPLIALCGKGVCFDTGGYDLKPSAAMLKMKKDMGGAAIALGVAQAVMSFGMRVRLDVRIGCVENSISGHAMRPLDVLRTRSGLSVEVGNTDAEGRLVLADLLTDAASSKPDWLIDFATLTGAARVALGPDLPALFSNDDALAEALLIAGDRVADPMWRLPLWHGYSSWMDSRIADCSTTGSKPMAGAITAALFLERFVPANTKWAHIDTYAWNDQSRPARPEGGEAQSLRATVAAIEKLHAAT